MSTHALTERAMTMNLSVGMWQGYRLDKEASRKVTESAGAKSDAARVNKHLVSKESLAPVVTAAGNVRTHFYANTLPWKDNGDRLMPRKQFLTFIPQHELLVSEFKLAVRKFLQEDYPSAIEQAQFRMGDLFKPDDYPSARELERRFYIDLDYDAVSTANDFRVQMDQEHVDKVKAAMESAAERRLQAAMADIWTRIGEAVGRFHERMSDPKNVFRDTTVSNVQELIDLIPGLNVLDDPNIEAVRKMIAEKLGGVEAKEIRKDEDYRQHLSTEAKEILDKAQSFAKAFGASFS